MQLEVMRKAFDALTRGTSMRVRVMTPDFIITSRECPIRKEASRTGDSTQRS